MPLYESVIIARQDMSPSQVDALSEEMGTQLTEGEGRIVKKEYWGLRTMAYRMKKNRKGHYLMLNIDAPAPVVQEMERLMRLNEDILRYMTIRVEEFEEGPSVMMQKPERERGRRGDRGERGDRGGRGGDRGDRGPRGGDRGDRGPRGGDRGGDRPNYGEGM